VSVEIKQRGEVTQVVISDEMTIYSAAELKDKLVNILHDHNHVELDLSAVEEMDSAGLQILLLLKLESQRQEKDLHVVRHSQAVIAILELLNLVLFFGDPIIIPADWKRGEA
jgi:anti-anti-sigma factor